MHAIAISVAGGNRRKSGRERNRQIQRLGQNRPCDRIGTVPMAFIAVQNGRTIGDVLIHIRRETVESDRARSRMG
jgi:hypothetical protein